MLALKNGKCPTFAFAGAWLWPDNKPMIQLSGTNPMEGINTNFINKESNKEFDNYQYDIALAIGYHHPTEDCNVKNANYNVI